MRLESDSKEDNMTRRSDDLLSSQQSSSRISLISGQPSTTENSTTTEFTKYSAVSVSTFSSSTLAAGNGTNTLFSPVRRPKSVSSKAFRPISNVPPLDFGKAGLVGRNEEISALKSSYDRLVKNGKKELILVGGQSGSGKSTLMRSVENEISVEGIFVEGKFNMNTNSEPYSGVAKAFGIVCQRVKEAGSKTIMDLREDLTKELGNKSGLLVQMIPELQDILAAETAPDDSSSVGSIDRVDETEGGVERLRFAFRVLTRVFSAVFSPFIMFLDDLQWADVSSLQIVEYLISDTENDNPLMIIGSYRSEEVGENSLLQNKMVTLREKTDKFHYNITELTIEAFSVTDTQKIVMTVLPAASADDTLRLASLCHKRTLGNPFFTIEFLKMLHFEGMLAFDKTSDTWSWNLPSIEEATMSTANVVVMLEQHLRKLPGQTQALLQCAAYLGSTFKDATIDLVWNVYGRRLVDKRIEAVSSLLPGLVVDGVFEKGEGTEYRWAHDKLQEAALCLSGQRRETFQLDIGKTLYYGLTKEQVEEDLFTIVDLINNGNLSKRPEFVAANLRAAEKAREISAFQSAAEYAAEGISLLKDHDWTINKSTVLRLYTIGAEAELILGNVDTTERYREAVLCQSDLSTLEVLPLQISKAKALGDVELKHKEALEYCLKLLKNLDGRLTWIRSLAFPQAVVKFLRIAKRAQSKPESFYESMKTSHDTKQRFIGFLLSKVVYNAYLDGDIPMYLLSTVKLVDMTLQFGANEFSATAFTFLAVFSIVVLKDYEAMERFQNIALGMLKKFRGMHNAETIFVGHELGLLWVKPQECCRAIIEEGILAGRREGDSVYTSWCIMSHVIHLPCSTGHPIHAILEGCPGILAEFEETKQAAHVLSTKTYYQMFLNLSDPSCENPSLLFGEIYTYTKDDVKENIFHLAGKIVVEGALIFWHGDYEIIAERALKIGETYAKIAPAVYGQQMESFHRAVALYAAALRTKKRKYKGAANKIRKRIAMWAQYGNTTVQYYSVLLLAMHLALKKKHKDAKLKYEESLEAVGRLGHLHHLGLFNELYSDFLSDQNKEESRYRLREAIRYFREWGAIHKAQALESRLQKML